MNLFARLINQQGQQSFNSNQNSNSNVGTMTNQVTIPNDVRILNFFYNSSKNGIF